LLKITVVPTITMTVLAPGFTLFFPSFFFFPLIKTLTMLPLTETLIIRFLTVTFTTGLVAADVAEGFGVADAVGVAAGVGFTVDGTTVRTA
jgi:hypothetical protein